MSKLTEFLEGPYRVQWLNQRGQSVYVRKSQRHLWGAYPQKVLDIANIETSEKKQGKGRFKTFLDEALVEAYAHGYVAIYIENVLTPRFAEYFRRTGWTEIEGGFSHEGDGPSCFYTRLPWSEHGLVQAN